MHDQDRRVFEQLSPTAQAFLRGAWSARDGAPATLPSDSPLTVGDLVEHLKTLPSDLRVCINGYERGLADVVPARIHRVRVRLDTNSEGYYGPHEPAASLHAKDAGPGVEEDVILIDRYTADDWHASYGE